MKKAFLVMDMPERCRDCDLFICYRQYAGDSGDCFCGKTKQDTPSNGVPSWCPLKPMPEKETICCKYDSEYYANGGKMPSWKMGWNACIDAICGKE